MSDNKKAADAAASAYTGTEFDKAHVFIDITVFTGFGIGDDASCHRSGNLTCHYFYTFGSFNYHCRTFVVRTGFR